MILCYLSTISHLRFLVKILKLLLSIVRFDDQYGKKRRKIVGSRDRLLAGKLALFIHGGSPEISLWEPVLSDV